MSRTTSTGPGEVWGRTWKGQAQQPEAQVPGKATLGRNCHWFVLQSWPMGTGSAFGGGGVDNGGGRLATDGQLYLTPGLSFLDLTP